MFRESFKFFTPPITRRRSCKFFAKLNGNHSLIANFSRLGKYQTFGLIEYHNSSSGQLADRIFKLWKSCVYDYRAVVHTTFEILTFQFFQLRNNFCQKFYGKTILFQHKFQKSISRCSILLKIRTSTIVILKWRAFE